MMPLLLVLLLHCIQQMDLTDSIDLNEKREKTTLN